MVQREIDLCGYFAIVTSKKMSARETTRRFSLFFIPIIPYESTYSVSCPNCGSHIKITRDQYFDIKDNIDESRIREKEQEKKKLEMRME